MGGGGRLTLGNRDWSGVSEQEVWGGVHSGRVSAGSEGAKYSFRGPKFPPRRISPSKGGIFLLAVGVFLLTVG